MANIITQVTSKGIISYQSDGPAPEGVVMASASLSETVPKYGTFTPTLLYRGADGVGGSAVFRWVKVGNLVTLSGEVVMNCASSQSFAHCVDLPEELVPVSRSFGPGLLMQSGSTEAFYQVISGAYAAYAAHAFADANPTTWVTGSTLPAITVGMDLRISGAVPMSGSAIRIPFSVTYPTA